MNSDIEKFKKLFADHYSGDPWIEVNILQTLDSITAKEAAQKIGNLNSIWSIVNHMIGWRETLLKRISNEDIASPADNFFGPISDHSPLAWKETLARLASSQDALLFYLSAQNPGMDEYPNKGSYSRFELLQGILQHDVYHLGQIVLIRKLLQQGKTG
jgi:uncharacterized damage-inducible protein DinB